MSGKGSKPRPFSVDTETFHDNWDKIFESENPLERPFEMWSHYCKRERASMRIMKGEACNWCGIKQDGTTD